MAFCARGKCKFTKTSPKGYPQCSTCGRVNISGVTKRVASQPAKSRRTRKSTKRRSSPKQSHNGYYPNMGDLRIRAPSLRKKQTEARNK